MAKQVGPVFFTGTIDGIIFYKLGDQYYSRSKGAYKSAKHMRRNPKYQRTMQQADQFGEASKITQEVYYRCLPKSVRKHGLFGKLTGRVYSWLQQGKSKEEAEELLIAHCQTLVPVEKTATPAPSTVKPLPVTATVKTVAPTVERKPILIAPKQVVKKARYLSRWKVKRNGRLQVPINDAAHLRLSGSEQKCSDAAKAVAQVLVMSKHPSGGSPHCYPHNEAST
jgi:hypothetical protein